MFRVDLNADLGESFGNYTIGMDEAVIEHVTSVNVACGWHAGDPVVLAKTLRLAKAHGVAVGAHPGFPDLLGFGRRNMTVTPDEAEAYVLYQLGALYAFARAEGVEIQHCKPHGALYNMAGKDIRLATGICRAVARFDKNIILLGLAGSKLLEAAAEQGLRSASEVFADRGYEEDGALVARSKPGAMISDENEAVARVSRMVREGMVRTVTGKDIPIRADSVCVHGDNASAVEFVRTIRAKLEGDGVVVRAFGR